MKLQLSAESERDTGLGARRPVIEGSVQTTANELSKMKIVDENCGLVIVLLLLLRTGSKSKQEPQIDGRWRSSGPRVRVKERTSRSLRMPKMPIV